MKILHICSEVAPFSKTGGLADVMSGLPKAQAQQEGIFPIIVTPKYADIDPLQYKFQSKPMQRKIGLGNSVEDVSFFVGSFKAEETNAHVPVYFVSHPVFSERSGIYGPKGGQISYADNVFRYALLCKAALSLLDSIPVDVIHGHDWQGALAMYYASKQKHLSSVARVFTIHNLAFQGLCSLLQAKELGIASEDLTMEGLEFYGQASLLKAGVIWADKVSTVSPKYSQEIQTVAHGQGLDLLLRKKREDLVGILNGVDTDVWNPKTDPVLARNYGSADVLQGKAACKAALQKELGFAVSPRTALFGTISRLTEQKGIDLLLQLIHSEKIRETEVQFVILGKGDSFWEQALLSCAQTHSAKMVCKLGYDEGLAHRIEAGSDMYLMPSLFEPCGLNQMYSQRYGTVPIVHGVGGLFDTVKDYDAVLQTGSGFVFFEHRLDSFLVAFEKALRTYQADPVAFLGIIRRGMNFDFSFRRAAKEYILLYQEAKKKRETDIKLSATLL